MGGDNSRSHSQDLLHILGFASIYRACKSHLSKCYPDKHSLFFKKTGNKTKPKPIEEDIKIKKNSDRDTKQEMHDPRQTGQVSPKGSRSWDDNMTRSSPQWSPQVPTSTGRSPLSRTASHGSPSFSRSTSRRSHNPIPPAKDSLLRSMSQRNSVDRSSAAAFGRSLTRTPSKTSSTPIVYTNSSGIIKTPAIEQQLDCTLEELCFGCNKKIKITRNSITDNGQIVEEDEVLRIKVKPGWTKGTKITFEGMGNEIPGTNPADVVFVVAEKKHTLFTRREDDLELGLEIPLVDALTGCTLRVPLLGDQTMSLTISDVVYPGYEKIVTGQGMPKPNEPGTRGNLIIKFSIKFPEELTEEQRSDAASILQHTC